MASEPFLIAVLTDIIRGLNAQRVDYALAGGFAYSALVEPRATTDLDLLVLLEDPSPEKLVGLFRPVFDAVLPHPAPMVFKRMSIWRVVGTRGGREAIVDLLLAQSDFHRKVLERKREVDFLGLMLPIVTIEDLVLLKAMAGRLQDLADLERIKQQPGLQIDREYVRSWQVKLGLDPI